MSAAIPSSFGDQHLTFGWIDYTLFSGLLGLSLVIGVYFGFFSKQDSTDEYLYGGKKMSYVPVATSILASLLSGITFLGIPTETYVYGSQVLVGSFGYMLSCATSAYIFLPGFHDLKLCSCYEYLGLRFSRSVRTLASFLYTISLLLYIPIVIYVPSLAFSQVTGYKLHTIAPMFSLVCIIYTTMGGVKAVVWTDTIQFIFTVGGLFTVLAIGLNSVGGFSQVWKIAEEGGRLEIIDWNPNPFERNNFWSMMIGGYFTMTGRFGAGQKFVQRFLAIEKKVDVQKAVGLMALGWFVLNLSCILTGLIVYAKYHGCDPLTAKLIQRTDETLPFYVMDVAGHISGLPGVFLAGLVSSALSTMSASLNSLSGIIYNDFIDVWINDGPKKDTNAAKMMKVISVLIGVITVAMVFIIEKLGTIFEMANKLSSVVDGPLLALFLLGFLVPCVGKRGALWGTVIGFTVMTSYVMNVHWLTINHRIHYPSLPTSVEDCPYPLNETAKINVTSKPLAMDDVEEPLLLFRISFFYFTMLGTLLTIISAIIFSIALGETSMADVNPKHVSPVVRRFLPQKKDVNISMDDTMKIPKC
ncbi:hypothetical protein QAD02_019095 [Eretmocerus hayati]|uniref:Uncharacterized protein n=1 Tax=Eretmocerus hayati TaxID=131215 RepID=A0ACC2PIM3_9HYME|nr:hypothetical protein QAD02_019095 [Eretmocerus hayati]